jgi:capsular polysaccharide biosynthesis protein
MTPTNARDPQHVATESITGSPEFDYAPGQPNLYKMMRYKQSLVRQHSVAGAFEEFRRKFGLPHDVALKELPLCGERDFAAQFASRFFETSPAGDRFEHAPPVVIGEGNQRTVKGRTRSQYVACVEDARVRGRSSAIVANGVLLLDYQGEERFLLDDELDWDPSIFQAGDHTAWHIELPGSGAEDLDEAFMLMGAHTDFFGHWMCEYLPKLVAARLSARLPLVPVLIDSSMPASHRQSLEMLYPGEIEIIEVPAFKPLCVRKLWVAPTPSYMPLHEKRNERFSWDKVAASPQLLAPLIAEMLRRADLALGDHSSFPERVFLSRKAFRHRKLVNSTAIESQATARGFRVVYPEDHSFAQQVALLRNARYVVALEGSALFLTYFCGAGTKVCVLSHPLTDVLADYNEVFQVQRIAMVALTGPIVAYNEQTPHDSDYSIEEAAFCRFMDGWLS